MRKSSVVMLALGALVVAGCSRFRQPEAAEVLQSIRAELSDASGRRVGEVTIQQLPRGVLMVADLSSLPSGTHAMHFHETGRCVPPFESAGGHHNPTGTQHGYRNPAGHHAGDLPNIHVTAGGAIRVEHYVEGPRLTGEGGLVADDGAAIVIHQFADDYSSDPAGASGDRIACGVLMR